MNNGDLNSIFEQINNLKKPVAEPIEMKADKSDDTLREVLNSVSEEIQRVLDENNFTQEDLCRITNMSQSNISKIQNGKVVPRIETLQKIATATHTRLVISFESMGGDDQ
ncbi:MAG: helix-turn-helix domain-containing protein [Lachnospiraceae bacterium]